MISGCCIPVCIKIILICPFVGSNNHLIQYGVYIYIYTYTIINIIINYYYYYSLSYYYNYYHCYY